MGWSGGSGYMSDVIASLKKNVGCEDTREMLYFDLIQIFEDMDCDTLFECVGVDKAYDAVLKEVHPGWFEEDE